MWTGAALRALALLGTTAASVVMFARSISGMDVEAFVRSNALPLHDRLRVMAMMAAAFVVAAAAGAVYGWLCGVAELRRLSHRLAPLAVLGLLPPLCTPTAWPEPLNVALAIGAFVLLAERLLRLSFEAEKVSGRPLSRLLPEAAVRWLPVTLAVAGALGYAGYMSMHALWMHGRFQTYGYDLGQYDNVFWSTLHGHPLHDEPLSWTENWSELAGHADLSTFFFLPFYAIKPGAPALLVMQACALGLGAIPLYRFAARRLPRSYACVIALTYLLYPPMHGLQFYDFHMQPMASTFVLLVIDFVDVKKYWLAALPFVVALGCREDVSIGLAVLGVFLTLSGHRPRAGVVMAVLATAYFVVIRFVIMPKFGPGWFQGIYKDLMPPGDRSFGGVAATLLTNPAYVFTTLLTAEKLRYALQILVPLAFLPLRRSYLAASLVHGSILTLLTTQYPATIDIGFQYGANFIPYVFPAAALAIVSLGSSSRRRAALGAMVIGTLLCGVFWGAIPPRKTIKGGFVTMSMTRPTQADRQKDKDLRELNALIPKDASVAMSEPEMPHVSRLHMRSLRDTTAADYILYGVGSGGYGGGNAERALAAGEFEKMAERPGLALLRSLDMPPNDPSDLVAYARWRASSAWGGLGGTFPISSTGQRWPSFFGHVFFHTLEDDSPWIEFDLGAVTPLHSFKVTNRRDSYSERAVPLVAETSTDGASWTEVAKRVPIFDVWSEPLASPPARYVRFRALRKTWLHFARVEIR